MENQKILLRDTWASIEDKRVDIIECIRLFDRGYENIYVITGGGA